MKEDEGVKFDALGRPVVDNSPTYKRWYNAMVERVTIGYCEAKAREEACTRRVGVWIVVGLLVAYGLWANFGPPMSGAYCEYPDPYGR